MSSKFISNTSIDQSLQNGTAFLNIKNIKVQDLQPNFPVKADQDKNIYSTKLSTSDITGLENVLTNPFDGTLEVKNLTTAYDTTPLDLNVFIQNTLNGLTDLNDTTQNQSATPSQTTFVGDVVTDNVKCDFLQDKTGSSLIEMGSTQINLNATNVSVNGSSMTVPPTTSDPNSAATKQYVDDNSGGSGDADVKTQNISLGLTDNTKTTFDKGNVIFGINPMEVLDDFSIKQELNFNTVSAPETGGFQFTIRNPILIKYVCFKVSHWGSTDTTKVWNLYDSDGEQLVTTLTLNKLKEYNGYYYTPFATPVLIPAGSYKCALILNNGDLKHNYSIAEDFFNDNLFNARGIFSSPDPAPTIAFPNGASNTPSSAIVFDLLEKVVNNGTTELTQETKINSAKIGYEFDNYYLDGLGDGAGNLYGIPSLTANAVYTNVLALGGVGATAGKVTYEILDLIKSVTVVNIFKKFRFAPWNTDGGFIIADFGVWRVEYQNFPVAGTTKWNIYANSAVIYTNTTNLIPYKNNFSEEEITISFVVDSQTFIIRHYGNVLFTFTDNVPRTLTQAERNLYSVSGGALVGYTNTTTIYDQKVYNPSSNNPIVEITPTTARCNTTFSTQSMESDSKIECPDFRVSTNQGGIRGYADQRIIFDEISHELQIRSEDTTIGKIKLIATDETTAGNFNATQYKINGVNGEILKNPNNNENLIAGVNAGTFLNNGIHNILLGESAGRDINEGSNNVFMGYNAGLHIQGTIANPSANNIAIGAFSQQGVSAVSNGNQNVSIGQASLYSITTGSNNTCYGTNAGFSITTGDNNTMVGHFAGDSANGNFNTCIGHNALANGGTNRTAIGHMSRCDGDNQICLGNGSVSQIINTGDGACDLGSATHQFKDVYVGGSIIGGGLPIVSRVRIPKTPDKPPTTGNAVYEDEYIRLGWDQATANDLEIQRTPASSEYLSTCYKEASTSSNVISVVNSNTTYTLNNFTFAGGEIMKCRLSPFQDNTKPTYEISIHYTESSFGTDDDLDWLIIRYN